MVYPILLDITAALASENILALPLLCPPVFYKYFVEYIPFGSVIVYAYAFILVIYFCKNYRFFLRNRSFLMLICFIFYVAIQGVWRRNDIMYFNKFYLLIINGFAYFCAGAVLISDKKIFRFTKFFLVFVSFVFSAGTLYFGITQGYDFLYGKKLYQVFSYYVAMGVVVFVPYLFEKKYRAGKKFLLIFLLVCLFMTGGVAAPVLVIFSLCIAGIYIYRLNHGGIAFIFKETMIILLLVVSILITLSISWHAPLTVVVMGGKSKIVKSYIVAPDKINKITAKNESILERLDIYKMSIPVLRNNFLFGTGFGNWQKAVELLNNCKTIYTYPHNIIVELQSETGFVGLILFAAVIYFAFIPIGDIRVADVFVAKVGLFFWILIHFISCDLPDNWFFLFLGMASIIDQYGVINILPKSAPKINSTEEPVP